MKCQLRISQWCKKVFREKARKIIDGKECCYYCYWLQKQRNKDERLKDVSNA